MIRRWLTLLPLTLTVAGSVVVSPATASAATPPTASCRKTTGAVQQTVRDITQLGDDLVSSSLNTTTLAQGATTVCNDVTAAQTRRLPGGAARVRKSRAPVGSWVFSGISCGHGMDGARLSTADANAFSRYHGARGNAAAGRGRLG